MRKHFVTFLSPGTFVAEQTTEEIASWDIEKAVVFASSITERHGAKPYGFYFTTCLVAEPISDGEGGKLDVAPKQVAKSGTHFLGGTLLTIDTIAERDRKDEKILLSNMRCNDWPIVVQNANSYLVTQPFREEDMIVNFDRDPVMRKKRQIITRGDLPELVAYRQQKIAEHKVEMETDMAKYKERK